MARAPRTFFSYADTSTYYFGYERTLVTAHGRVLNLEETIRRAISLSSTTLLDTVPYKAQGPHSSTRPRDSAGNKDLIFLRRAEVDSSHKSRWSSELTPSCTRCRLTRAAQTFKCHAYRPERTVSLEKTHVESQSSPM